MYRDAYIMMLFAKRFNQKLHELNCDLFTMLEYYTKAILSYYIGDSKPGKHGSITGTRGGLS